MGRRTQRIATVGVYGATAESFLRALAAAEVRRVIDVRQRRGVRGAEYAWANARRLQALLDSAGIGYSHHRELAPSNELRQLQYRDDAMQGVGKRNREVLAPQYVTRYTEEVLDRADLRPLIAEVPAAGIAALLCVEASAAACHRSLVAARLERDHDFRVLHLTSSTSAHTDLAIVPERP